MNKLFYVLLLCIASSAFAQKGVMTPEKLMSLGRVSEIQPSFDGKQILFAVRKYNLESNSSNNDLYVLNTETGNVKQITNSTFSEFNARWIFEDSKIAYISSESGSQQIWICDKDGLDRKQVSAIETGVNLFEFDKVCKKLFFASEVKISPTVKERYPDLLRANAKIIDGLAYRHWNYWEDENFSHIFIADFYNETLNNITDIMEGEPYDAPLMPFGGNEQIAWSADAKKLAYTSKKLSGTSFATSTNSDIYLYNTEDKTTKNISSYNKGYDTEPRFSPDGTRVAWLSMERDGYEADKNRIFVLETFNYDNKAKDYTIGFDETVSTFSWKDKNTIYFEAALQGTYQFLELNLQPAKGKSAIRRITDGQHDLHSLTINNELIYGTRNSISMPAEIVKINPQNGLIAQLTNINQSIMDETVLGKVEKRMVATSDGKEMLTWVIYPPNFDPTKKYPTLLYCQGGPQSTVSQFFSYRWNFQTIAAEGYIIVAPNRRGLPSFGTKWNEDISGDWGGQAMRDYLAAIDDISKESYVDTARRGAIGASYGGYSVYFLAGIHKNRFKTFVSHCGLFNLESFYGTTEEIFFADFDLKGPYWNTPKPKSYDAFSPHKFVQNWNTPILVIHNELDYRVPLTQGMEAFTAAQLRGIKSRFLYFENEGHWVTKPQNSVLWHREMFRWLKETL